MDVIGKRFGRLVVLRRKGPDRPLRYQVECACDCGKEWSGYLYLLTGGDTKSCGCLQDEVRGANQRGIQKAKDLTGLVFGRLTVVERDGIGGSRSAAWICLCECGTQITTTSHSLRVAGTKSCGCLQKEKAKARMTKHGQYQSREYTVWEGMIGRCKNSKAHAYKHYGARGIGVCDRWLKFENFYADMGQRPKRTSLDRIDNNGNYEPGNCRWATKAQQMRNLRNNRWYEFRGERKILPDWAKDIGMNYFTLRSRIGKGWSIDRALTEEVRA